MKCACQCSRELGVDYGIRRDSIHWPSDRFVGDRERDQSHDVVNVDPRHPLLSISYSAPDAEFERQQHFLQRAAVAGENHSEPKYHYANPEPFCRSRFALPFPAPRPRPGNPRRAARIPSASLHHAIRNIPIADALINTAGGVFNAARASHKLPRAIHAAGSNPLLRRRRPSLRHWLTRQMHHRVARFKIFRLDRATRRQRANFVPFAAQHIGSVTGPPGRTRQ